MSTKPFPLSRWLLRVGAGIVLLATGGWAWPPPTASIAIPPIPQGEARVWFYRDLEPYETLARPFIRMNRGVVGISEPDGAFYRDVPAGYYLVTVDSYGRDFNQFANVLVVPGQEVYVKILSLRGWVTGGGGGRGGGDYARNTFYAWLMPTELARADVGRTPFFGGS